MTTITIDDGMSLGELLSKATDQVMELRSPTGDLLATLFLESEATEADYAAALQRAEENIEELQRRRRSPMEGDLSTVELLSRLAALESRK